MAHKNHAEILAVIEAVRALQDTAKEKLTVVPTISTRVLAPLQKLDNYLSYLIGIPLRTGHSSERRKFGPIILPKPVVEKQQQEIKSAAEMEADQLRMEVKQAYPTFTDRDTDELMDSLTDMQVRGIALKAGLHVTERDPERITPQFIEEIKEKIRTNKVQKEILEQGQKGVEDEQTENVEGIIEENDGEFEALPEIDIDLVDEGADPKVSTPVQNTPTERRRPKRAK